MDGKKYLTFAQAMMKVEDGYSVRREEWEDDWYVYQHPETGQIKEFSSRWHVDRPIILSGDDTSAKDWVVR